MVKFLSSQLYRICVRPVLESLQRDLSKISPKETCLLSFECVLMIANSHQRCVEALSIRGSAFDHLTNHCY